MTRSVRSRHTTILMDETLLHSQHALRFLYREHSLLITDPSGWLIGDLHGLYERDLRILSRYRVWVNGHTPSLSTFSLVEANSSLAYYIVARRPGVPDLDILGFPEQEAERDVVMQVARSVGSGLAEEIEFSNHGLRSARLRVAFQLDADFADLEEAKEKQRVQTAPISRKWERSGNGRGELRIHYQHPALDRGVLLRFEGPPDSEWRAHSSRRSIVRTFDVGPQMHTKLSVSVAPIVNQRIFEATYHSHIFAPAISQTDRVREEWTSRATQLETTHPTLRLTWDRAISDLGSLALGEGETDAELAVPAAGMPFYGALFGRDVLTATGQAMIFSPTPAAGALRLLARHLGTTDDDFYDEQPGRVPQQVRLSPLALLGLNPRKHYYGDYAAPLAYLVLLGGFHTVTGDLGLMREFLPSAERVLDWVEQRADLDGDGFLEYQTRSPQGQVNQGWKDSGDAVVDADGREIAAPIASCEIQGYWYAAQLLMAEVYFSLHNTKRARELYDSAKHLKERFNERFWMDEEAFYAYALGPDKRQVKSIVSNVGHCLTTGIIARERVPAVVRRLMAPDLFSGWGIRTLSTNHPLYNPLRYHLGSVWPPENATIAIGMRRYGFTDECQRIVEGMLDAAALFPSYRLPETLGGFPRDEAHPRPGIYPNANSPQAWSSASVGWLVQALLGLWSFAPLKVLIIDPALPEWLPDLTLRGLQICDARVSMRFARHADGTTAYEVLENESGLHIIRQPPPEAKEVGPGLRLRDLVASWLTH